MDRISADGLVDPRGYVLGCGSRGCPRLADRADRPPREVPDDHSRKSPASVALVRERIFAHRGARSPGTPAERTAGSRRGAPAVNLRLPRCVAGLDAVYIPIRIPQRTGRVCRARPQRGGRRAKSGTRTMADVLRCDPATVEAIDSGRSPAGRALHTKRLRGGYASSIQFLYEGNLHAIHRVTRPKHRRGAGADARDTDPAHSRRRVPAPDSPEVLSQQRGKCPKAGPRPARPLEISRFSFLHGRYHHRSRLADSCHQHMADSRLHIWRRAPRSAFHGAA